MYMAAVCQGENCEKLQDETEIVFIVYTIKIIYKFSKYLW